MAYMFGKEDLFACIPIAFDTFIRFFSRISSGYKQVAYHTKTHGADVAQVSQISLLI